MWAFVGTNFYEDQYPSGEKGQWIFNPRKAKKKEYLSLYRFMWL